jgi:uncharacterized phage protein (TIGR01671 family)
MREILFRGKATNRDPNIEYRTTYKNGDWVYGLMTDLGFYMGFAKMTNIDGVSGIDVDRNTIGQYTGLTDKNGKRIFEGDIISGAVVWLERRKLGIVDFRHGSFGLVWHRGKIEQFCPFTSMCNIEYEIVGNIHDNPDMIGKEI